MTIRTTITALIIWLSGIGLAYGQSTLSIPESNIINRSEYRQTYLAGSYFSLLGVAPGIRVRANTANFENQSGGSQHLPLSSTYLRLAQVGGVVLLGSGPEVMLSQTYQAIYTALLELLGNGDVLIQARFPIAGTTWTAGEYQAPIQLDVTGVTLGGITPSTHNLTLSIPAFLRATGGAPAATLHVDDLSLFRSGAALSSTTPIQLSSSLPYIPSIRAESANFNFSSQAAYNQLPVVPVSELQLQLISPVTSPSISLSTNRQDLIGNTGLPVPVENNESLTYNYNLPATSLQQYFTQAGNYSTSITYGWRKTQAAYPPGELQSESNALLHIVVDDLSEIIANQVNIDLVYGSASDYQQGVYTDLPGHIRLSKTTPYNLYVRAESNAFQSGTDQIPLQVLQIGPSPGQADLQTVTLSTSNQLLLESSSPVIDRLLDVRYTIPASASPQLLEKPAAVYSADIIFSLVAP